MFEPPKLTQPHLFDFTDPATGVMELFPTVWTALERLVSNNMDRKNKGLDQLLDLDAHRLSSLVAYVLATCLSESDVKFRFRIVQALGNLFSKETTSPSASDAVLQSLKTYLSKMRRRRIYALLEVAEFYPASVTEVAALIKTCSHAGGTLADIFSDRKIPVELRRHAINISGIVGFLDVIPALERLAGRLESRMGGQREMPFAPPDDVSEKSLLPTVQTALTILQSP
jgi:hypothetical protein